MNAVIDPALLVVFQNINEPSNWLILKDAFKKEGYHKVYPYFKRFADESVKMINTEISFPDPREFLLFLENEKDLAMNSQEFEHAAFVEDLKRSVKGSKNNIPGYLKYKLFRKEDDVLEFQFETNILTFKYMVYERFI